MPPRPSASPIRVGTRQSPLALWQAEWVRGRLAAVTSRVIQLVPMETSGDRVRGALALHGGKGLFVKELDAALLAAEIDCAVHSLKDIPGKLAAGVAIAAVSPREDPHDLLITATGMTLAQLPHGARVGTSSPRRQWQLAHRRPDLQFAPVRGNVATRVARVQQEALEAVVVAAAGMKRLGLSLAQAAVLPIAHVVPAVGQGTMAITVRTADTAMTALLEQACHDHQNAVVVCAERALLAEVAGDCYTPLAGYAEWVREEAIVLHGFYARADGTRPTWQTMTAPAGRAAQLGQQLAHQLRTKVE